MQKLRQNSDYILSLGLIGVFVPLIVYFIRQQFNIFGQIVFVLGFLCLGLYIGLEYQRILRALAGRQVRYGGNSLLMTILFIGIVALIAFMSQRYSKRIDLTANRSYSISQQSKKVIDNLGQPVKVWVFYSPYGNRSSTEALLKSYQASSGGKLTYEFVDTDAHPTQAAQYGLAEGEADVLVMESGGRRQKVTGTTESDITSGLLKLSSDKQKVIYILTGEGERSPDDATGNGLAQAKTALQKDNYVVKTLNLATSAGSAATGDAATTVTNTTGVTVSGSITGTNPARQYGAIPADAAALIIASPTKPIPDGMWQVISQWLTNGGKLYLLSDALGGETGLEGMLLANWGITLRNDLVIDTASSMMNDPSTLVVQQGSYSPITKDLKSNIILPGARSIIVPSDAGAGTTVTPLAQSTAQSWGETDLANLNAGVRYNQGNDAIGPLNLAVSVERDAPDGAKSRLVIVGCARFAVDSVITNFGNLDFFVNSVNWLTEDEQLISIRPQATESRTLNMPPSDARLFSLVTVAGMPLLVLALGAVVWWRRR